MTDLISRTDAIKAIRKCKFESVMPSDWYRGMEDAQDIVETLPSAEAVPIEKYHGLQHQFVMLGAAFVDMKGTWIPCSERLPSKDGSYIVTSSFGKVYTSHYYAEHGQWQCNRRGMIEAWMPLPKPYKGGAK